MEDIGRRGHLQFGPRFMSALCQSVVYRRCCCCCCCCFGRISSNKYYVHFLLLLSSVSLFFFLLVLSLSFLLFFYFDSFWKWASRGKKCCRFSSLFFITLSCSSCVVFLLFFCILVFLFYQCFICRRRLRWATIHRERLRLTRFGFPGSRWNLLPNSQLSRHSFELLHRCLFNSRPRK